MPHLTADSVCRFLRVMDVCWEAFGWRLTSGGPEHRYHDPACIAWRHADLFLAGFPRVSLKPGHDLLCWFHLSVDNRTSGLVGYRKDGPKMVRDRIDFEMDLESWDGDDRVAFVGTAREDHHVLLVPEIPADWNEYAEKYPDWLLPNPNLVLMDDGTPEGIFERAQLLLWSGEPVSLWHAVGYGHHAIQLSTPIFDESFTPTDAEGHPLPEGDPAGRSMVPHNWLPRVETGLSCDNMEWAPIPAEAEERGKFEGKTVNVVRFYTYSELGFKTYYEVTVWITDDVWHSEFRPILKGADGYIC